MTVDTSNNSQYFIELDSDEPPIFEVIDGDPSSTLVFLCDHASARIPRCLNNLGLESKWLEEHIAYDIGIAEVARNLAAMQKATLVMTNYSRLVIDPNRHLGTDSSVPEISDGVLISGNQNLSADAIRQRIDQFFWPYHNAVSVELENIIQRNRTPTVVSLHSFTPVFAGLRRPWEVGVLWNEDHRLAAPLISRLRSIDGLCVGDNEPYHARDPLGYSIDVHAESNQYPHVLLEIRQDQIDHADGGKHWSMLLHDVLDELFRTHVDVIETAL